MLLSLDMMSAFDRVIPIQLLHNMLEGKILVSKVKWVSSYISNRTTTLCLSGYHTDTFPMHTGIYQGLLLSPICFFFYNVNLVVA